MNKKSKTKNKRLKQDLIEIGTIVNTFGKKGTIKLMMPDNLEFNDEAIFEDKFLFYLSKDQVIEPLRIKKLSQTQRNLLLIDFFGISDLNAAEQLKGRTIYC
jgi:16S rRNA processing protein RimM